MPHFGENSEIWPRYWQSKLKSRFLPPSFSRPTSASGLGNLTSKLEAVHKEVGGCLTKSALPRRSVNLIIISYIGRSLLLGAIVLIGMKYEL